MWINKCREVTFTVLISRINTTKDYLVARKRFLLGKTEEDAENKDFGRFLFMQIKSILIFDSSGQRGEATC